MSEKTNQRENKTLPNLKIDEDLNRNIDFAKEIIFIV